MCESTLHQLLNIVRQSEREGEREAGWFARKAQHAEKGWPESKVVE